MATTLQQVTRVARRHRARPRRRCQKSRAHTLLLPHPLLPTLHPAIPRPTMFRRTPLTRLLRRPATTSLSPSPSLLRLASHVPPRHDFASLTPSSISSLLKLVASPAQIISTIAPSEGVEGFKAVGQEELDGYNQDWMDKYKGHGQVVARPKTPQEVADIVSHGGQASCSVVRSRAAE